MSVRSGWLRTSGLLAKDIKHKLRVWPGKTRLRIGRLENGAVVPTDEGVKFVEALAARAEKGCATAVIGMDTLVSLFEGLDENSASQMDKALGLIAEIADAGFAAIDVMHHTGKASPSETTTSYRGSSAIFAAVAEMSTLVPLPAEDAERFRLPPDQAQRTRRLAGQRQRDGAIPGVWYFEREVVSLVAQDPRDPQSPVSKTIATLKAIRAPAAPGVKLDDAHWALWSAQLRGKRLRRGGLKGPRHRDHAGAVVEAALSCGRTEAEAAVAGLIDIGSAIAEEESVKGNPVVFIVVSEPVIPF